MTAADYERWNGLLSRFFLREERGRPLYLYVDHKLLDELWERDGAEAGSTHFVRTVREACLGAGPFDLWRKRAIAWEREGAPGDPPFLAVLAFLVLPASERTSAKFRYYPELNPLLGLPDDDSPPPGFSEVVPSLFGIFNRWLDGVGASYGTPTASSLPHYSYVGWPISQALMRPVDRVFVQQWFRVSRIPAGAKILGPELLRRVMLFARQAANSPSRERVRDLARNRPEVLQHYLLRELAAWNGFETDIGPTLKSLVVSLVHAEGDESWWFCANRATVLSGKIARIGALAQAIPARGSLFHLDVDNALDLLGRGPIGLVEDGPALVSKARTAYFMSVDKEVGGWKEQDRRNPGDRQLCLVRVGSAADLRLSALDVAHHREAPSGWSLYELPAGPDVDLIDGGTASPRLVGGLVLNSSTRSYLVGGAPDVRGCTSFEVDGTSVSAISGTSRLCGLDLGLGDHVVVADGTSLSFRLVEGLPPGETSVRAPGWPVDGGMVHPISSSSASAVRGASVPGGAQKQTIVPACSSLWVLGEAGELAHRAIKQPRWLQTIGLSASERDVTSVMEGVGFEPAFLVLNRSNAAVPSTIVVCSQAGDAAREHGRRPYPVGQARAVLGELLSVGYRLTQPKAERRFRKALSAALREVGK